MSQVQEYLDMISKRINTLCQNIVILRSCVVVYMNTKDNKDKVHSLFNALATEQAVSSSVIVLNLNIILDDEKDSISIIKILRMIQSNPKEYGVDVETANLYYNKLIPLINSIKSDESFLVIREIRDQVIAHSDVRSLSKTYQLPENTYRIIRFVLELTNFLLSAFQMPQNEFDIYKKSSLEELFDEITPTSTRIYRKMGTEQSNQ